MRSIFLILLSLSLVSVSSISFAKDNLWKEELTQALQKAKTVSPNEGGGLAYTSTQGSLLEKAIKKAMETTAPPCRAMKIAVNFKYSPYSVIKYIVGYGSEIDLKKFYICATKNGITKPIFAKAVADAVSPLEKPIYSRNESIQAQSLAGLGYTPYESFPNESFPTRIKLTSKPRPISATSPSTEPGH